MIPRLVSVSHFPVRDLIFAATVPLLRSAMESARLVVVTDMAGDGSSDCGRKAEDHTPVPTPSAGTSISPQSALQATKLDIAGMIPDGHLSRGWKKPTESSSLMEQILGSGESPRHILQSLFSIHSLPSEISDEMALQMLMEMFFNGRRSRERLPQYSSFDDAVELFKSRKNIIVLSGAGISVSCGIPDFRSENGIYARLKRDFPELPDPHAMFDIDFFQRDPTPFYNFAREIFPGQFRASLAHMFVHFLEQEGKLLRNYTQNIDTLERVTGIKRVVECHGSFLRFTCLACKREVESLEVREAVFSQRVPKCAACKEGVMKPNIVFFGEDLSDEFHVQMTDDQDKIDLLVVIGSSLKVNPVALIPFNIDEKVPQVLINREQLPHYDADIKLLGMCDDIVVALALAIGGPIREKMLKELEDRLMMDPWTQPLRQISTAEFKDSLDEPDRKRRAIDAPPNVNANAHASTASQLWETNYVQVESRLPSGTALMIPPNLTVFKGATMYYDRDNDSFRPRAGPCKNNSASPESSDISSSSYESTSDDDSDEPARISKTSSLPPSDANGTDLHPTAAVPTRPKRSMSCPLSHLGTCEDSDESTTT